MKQRTLILLCAWAATAAAQTGGVGYQGPGVLSRGAGDVGTRGGQQVELRFFATAAAVYDTGIQPFSLDSKGQLLETNALLGVEGTIGVYGVHSWRHATLGLDYSGNYRHYSEATFYDGSDHNLALGYSYRKSRRFAVDMRQTAGTSSRGLGSFNTYIPGDQVNQPSSLLFDNRTYFSQTSMSFNYIASARTILTAGGDGFLVRRQSKALIGMNGFSLNGGIQHRQTKNVSVGVNYGYQHYDYPGAFGEADVNTLNGVISTALGKRWTFSMAGGVSRAEVRGIQQVAVDPVIAALTGLTSVVRTFYRVNTLPSASVNLSGRFKRTGVSMNYSRGVNGGNGLYLTSRTETASATLSYTATRKASFSVSGSYNTLGGLSQGLSTYSQFNVSSAASYALGRWIHLTGRVDSRQTELESYKYNRAGYRASFGITISPGSLPVSFW